MAEECSDAVKNACIIYCRRMNQDPHKLVKVAVKNECQSDNREISPGVFVANAVYRPSTFKEVELWTTHISRATELIAWMDALREARSHA